MTTLPKADDGIPIRLTQPPADGCDYTGRACEHWEPGTPGSCLAVEPEQCPANSAEDIAAINAWRLRQAKPEPNGTPN